MNERKTDQPISSDDVPARRAGQRRCVASPAEALPNGDQRRKERRRRIPGFFGLIRDIVDETDIPRVREA
jgi:hypothetical protein